LSGFDIQYGPNWLDFRLRSLDSTLFRLTWLSVETNSTRPSTEVDLVEPLVEANLTQLLAKLDFT